MWGETGRQLLLDGEIGERTLSSDPDSIPLLPRGLDSFTSLFLGTVPLPVSQYYLSRI